MKEINSSFTKQIELLENIALKVSNFIEDKGFKTLITHPEDRISLADERGLISNKAVAKAEDFTQNMRQPILTDGRRICD